MSSRSKQQPDGARSPIAYVVRKATPYVLWAALFMALFAASAGTRLYGIRWKPLWLDEVEHLYDTHPGYDFETVLKEAAGHVQPPLDHVLLWKVRKAWPHPAVVRIPYAVYALVFCILVWAWAGRVFSLPGLLATGCWLAVSSFHIYYAQEVRMYGLMMMLAVAYFLALDIALRSHSLLMWIACVVLATLNLHTNIFATLTLLTSGVYVAAHVAVRWWTARRERLASPARPAGPPRGKSWSELSWPRRILRILDVRCWPDILKWAIVIAVAAWAFYPAYDTYLAGNLGKRPQWEQGGLGSFALLKSFKTVFIDFSAKPKGRLTGVWFFGVLVLAGLVPRRKWEVPFCVTAVAMLFAYPAALSYLFSERSNVLFKTRYVCQAFPFFVIALGAGIVHIAFWLSWLAGRAVPALSSGRAGKLLAYALVAAGTACALVIEWPATRSVLQLEKSPWRKVAERVKERYTEENIITSQLDVALRWNLERYLSHRKNWQYVGLEELPKLSIDAPARLWLIVDKRKLRTDLANTTNAFEVTEIDAYYPSIYLFRSRKLLNWQETMKAAKPFSDKMDPYAIITKWQYESLGKARAAAKEHNFKTAESAYRQALAIGFKKDIWINLEFARFLRAHRHYADAAPQYEEFLRNAADAHKMSVVEEMIDTYDQCGHRKKADALIRKYGTPAMQAKRKLATLARRARAALDAGEPMTAYTNYLEALAVSPSNATICRSLAEVCYCKVSPPRAEEALAWNTKASRFMEEQTGRRFIEADFNNAVIQERIGRMNTALRLYEELTDYLMSQRPLRSNWLFKSHVYLGVAREKSGHPGQALAEYNRATRFVNTPAERLSLSAHTARVEMNLGIGVRR